MRKAPSEHAREFNLGEHKKGNDGEMWEIMETSKGVKRWKKVKYTSQPWYLKKIATKSRKKQKKHHKKTRKHRKKTDSISLTKLKALMKKYNVVGAYTKHKIASALYRVWNAGMGMETKDLETILPLLEGKQHKLVQKLIQRRKDHPITDYKGMWKPQPKPLSKMSRKELIRHLRAFKKAWEAPWDARNQDIDFEGSDASLRSLLKYYYSNASKLQAEDWLSTNLGPGHSTWW